MDDQSGLSEIQILKQKVESAHLNTELLEKVTNQIKRIELSLRYGGGITQFEMVDRYIDWVLHLPWDQKTQDTLDIAKAKGVLDKNHYGLMPVKQRILEYLSVLTLQKQQSAETPFHAPTLFFVGLVGTGKTTLASSIAEALGRKFVRIPFGGLSSALDLRGQSKTHPESEPGMIIKSIRRAGVKNPVILLDELDRVTPEARASVMGVLVELLDPDQNSAFTDYFVDYPFDLSQVLFVATANNTGTIPTAVMDRLEVIQMPSYTDEEKVAITKQYVLPRALKEAGLSAEHLAFDESVWTQITRPLGYDAGMRSLERTVEAIVRKVAYRIVNGQGTNFTITSENLREYL